MSLHIPISTIFRTKVDRFFHIFPSCRYNEEVEGVILAYSDEKVLSQSAMVHSYFPLVRLIVSATLVVFKPRPGARLVGIVNKLSDDFIAIVVMGFMNVVVRVPDVRDEIRPRPADGIWVSAENSAHIISVGDSVAFNVVHVRHEGSFVTLSGALKRRDTGNVSIVGLKSEEQKTKDKKKKKRKEREREDTVAAAGDKQGNGANKAAAEAEPETSSKKKKRRKDKDEKAKKVEVMVEGVNKEKEKKNKGKKDGKEKKKKKDSSKKGT